MITLIVIESLIILIYLSYIIHTHSEKQVKIYVKLLTLLSWLLSFGLVIIVPLEIYYTKQQEESQYDNIIVDLWTTLYWINFVLTWFILPIYMEYESAGYFTFKQRIIKSLKINLIFYAVGAVFTIIFSIYLMIHDSFGIKSILAFFVVLSNAFGLTIVVFLLGYALVAVPRTLFRNCNLSIKLKSLYFQTYNTHSNLYHYQMDFEDHATTVLSLSKKYKNNESFQPYLQQILAQFPQNVLDAANSQTVNASIDEIGDLTLDKLATINQETKQLARTVTRQDIKLTLLTKDALFYEDLLTCQGKRIITSDIRPPRNGCCGSCYDRMVSLYYQNCHKYFMIVSATICTILTCLIILAEISIFANWDINIFSIMITKNEVFFVVQILCLIPIGYTLYCIQYGLLSIRLSMSYGFYDYKQTDAASLLFSSTFLSRISFPLAFNYFWMFDIDDSPLTSVVGNFNFDSYLRSFRYVIPILLIILVLINLCELYDRFLEALGIRRFQFTSQFDDDKIQEGKEWVESARKRLCEDQTDSTISNSFNVQLN